MTVILLSFQAAHEVALRITWLRFRMDCLLQPRKLSSIENSPIECHFNHRSFNVKILKVLSFVIVTLNQCATSADPNCWCMLHASYFFGCCGGSFDVYLNMNMNMNIH